MKLEKNQGEAVQPQEERGAIGSGYYGKPEQERG